MLCMLCIDLIFCTNQNVISNYGVDVSMFKKCYHNIIHGRIDIPAPLPSVYVRESWSYNKANVENIKKAVSNFNWNRAFENLSADEKVELLNETLLNIFRNYIANKKIKCEYRQPPWMTDNIKKSLKQRSKLTKIFYNNGQRNRDHIKVLEKSEKCTSLITEAEKNYIPKMTSKLENSNTAPKTYWSILNRLLYSKKILAIPPLLVDGNFISDFCEKANLFNNFFASICRPIKNNSRLPPFIYKTNTRIYCFCVTNKNILSIINSLDSSKAHGHDNISIKMINILKRVSYYIPKKSFLRNH